jgi:hypothetical protein
MEPACYNSRCASTSNNALKTSPQKRDRLGVPFLLLNKPLLLRQKEWVAEVSLLRAGFRPFRNMPFFRSVQPVHPMSESIENADIGRAKEAA